MVRRKACEVPTRLVRLQGQFAAWRKTRSVGERIPARLWTAAVKLAGDYGVNRTATVLGLDYYSLKRRMTTQAPNDQAASVVSGAFVEVPPISVPRVSECVIELVDGSGASMRIHFKGADAGDIVAVSGSLWKDE